MPRCSGAPGPPGRRGRLVVPDDPLDEPRQAPQPASLGQAHEDAEVLALVDGAHALGHFPFKLRDLECDAYGVSLHKWLLAPLGNGCLYVRREMILKFWPLQAAPEQQDSDVRKFEAIGTHPWAIRAALGESSLSTRPSAPSARRRACAT